MHQRERTVHHDRGVMSQVRAIAAALATVVLASACTTDARLTVAVQSLPSTLTTAELRYRIRPGPRSCSVSFAIEAFALPLDLRAPGADSVWLMWSGNSIKHPVVF